MLCSIFFCGWLPLHLREHQSHHKIVSFTKREKLITGPDICDMKCILLYWICPHRLRENSSWIWSWTGPLNTKYCKYLKFITSHLIFFWDLVKFFIFLFQKIWYRVNHTNAGHHFHWPPVQVAGGKCYTPLATFRWPVECNTFHQPPSV